MRGQMAGYTMKARLRAELPGENGKWRWIWEASKLQKFLMCKKKRIESCGTTKVAACFFLERLIESVSPSTTDNPNSFNLVCISYFGGSELELMFFFPLGPWFWLWCQMDGSWGAAKQPQTGFKHHSSWVVLGTDNLTYHRQSFPLSTYKSAPTRKNPGFSTNWRISSDGCPHVGGLWVDGDPLYERFKCGTIRIKFQTKTIGL